MREDVVFHQFNSVRSVLKGKELKEVRTTYLEEEEEEEEKGVSEYNGRRTRETKKEFFLRRLCPYVSCLLYCSLQQPNKLTPLGCQCVPTCT